METPSACEELKTPGVIDEVMIYNAVIDPDPKDEEGRLTKEEGVTYSKVKELRLEFLNILKIDHLWMMTNLTKLQLCNNIIEKIENLEMLTELRELDLSFNYIEKIENLENLTKLEMLILFENKIQVLENLDHLNNLTILSVGNNQITDYKNVIYLRGFDSLKSLTMAGNPISEDENFVNYIIAYLPQLVYYQYKMIREPQRSQAREMFMNDLVKLERDEIDEKSLKLAKKKAEEEDRCDREAFVEELGGEELFNQMFDSDPEGKVLLEIGEGIQESYAEFKSVFCSVTKEIQQLGLEQAKIRKAEVDEFNAAMAKASEANYSVSRKIIEDFPIEKEKIFNQIRLVLDNDEEDDELIDDLSVELQELMERFSDHCQNAWNAMMHRELYYYEACEEVNSVFERNLAELVNNFIEAAQGLFTQLRQLQGLFHESLSDSANKFFNMFTMTTAGGTVLSKEYASLPPELLRILQDRDSVVNALAYSHDIHMSVIDQREDKLINSVRAWLANVSDNIVRSEIERNRSTVSEIIHFLDVQRSELNELTNTPLGLILLLPKEMQEAFQI